MMLTTSNQQPASKRAGGQGQPSDDAVEGFVLSTSPARATLTLK
jgi:hypothetical protein